MQFPDSGWETEFINLRINKCKHMDIKIRKMELKDVDAVCIMEEEAFSMPWHKESFIDMISNRDALYLVAEIKSADENDVTGPDSSTGDEAENDGKADTGVTVCGCAGLISVLGEGSICNIVVKSEFRRLGIGRRLVQSMIEQGRSGYGIKDFTLEVRKSNSAAIGLYEDLGFVCEGIRPGFYDKPKEDACIYWLRS